MNRHLKGFFFSCTLCTFKSICLWNYLHKECIFPILWKFLSIFHIWKVSYSPVPYVLQINLSVKLSSQRVHFNDSLKVFEHISHLKGFLLSCTSCTFKSICLWNYLHKECIFTIFESSLIKTPWNLVNCGSKYLSLVVNCNKMMINSMFKNVQTVLQRCIMINFVVQNHSSWYYWCSPLTYC
jgi:hypothetical protein